MVCSRFMRVGSALLVLYFSLVHSASAAVIEDLFDAKIAVADQSDKAQNAAIKQALRQVFVKVSGNDSLLKDEKISKYVAKANSMVRAYSYEKALNQWYLVVNFDGDKVQQALRSADLAIWDKRRPDTILWLAVETNQQDKQIITSEQHPQLLERLKEQAKIRGLKIVLPLWDLNDVQSIGVYDIWGGFIQRIQEASSRYEMNSALSARVYKLPLDSNSDQLQRWQIDWTLLDNGQIYTGQASAADSAAAMDKIIASLAEQLAAKYAINQQNGQFEVQQTHIVLTNVDSILTYSEILRFLNGLSVVSKATLVNQQGQRSTFALELLGSSEDLLNILSLDSKISLSKRPGNKVPVIPTDQSVVVIDSAENLSQIQNKVGQDYLEFTWNR
jgi:uncharacterized protein